MGGEMHADGTYTITPFKGVSGLFPGTYVVRIAFYDLRPGGNPDSDAGFIERQYVVPEKLVIESGSRPVTYDVEVPAKPR